MLPLQRDWIFCRGNNGHVLLVEHAAGATPLCRSKHVHGVERFCLSVAIPSLPVSPDWSSTPGRLCFLPLLLLLLPWLFAGQGERGRR